MQEMHIEIEMPFVEPEKNVEHEMLEKVTIEAGSLCSSTHLANALICLIN